MRKGVAALLAASCLLGVALATEKSAGFSPDVFGFWSNTLGGGESGGLLDEILEAKKKLDAQLEETRATMLAVAEAQMHEMLEKIQSGEAKLEDDYVVSDAFAHGDGEEANATAAAAETHRRLGGLGIIPPWTPQESPVKAGLRQGYPARIFDGELRQAAQSFGEAKNDLKRCTFFGGQEICIPASRYFVRKSVGFSCDLQLKKSMTSPVQMFACGNPGVTTALCFEWPIEIKFASFIIPVTVPVCLPDARAIEATLNVLGGNILGALNLFL